MPVPVPVLVEVPVLVLVPVPVRVVMTVPVMLVVLVLMTVLSDRVLLGGALPGVTVFHGGHRHGVATRVERLRDFDPGGPGSDRYHLT